MKDPVGDQACEGCRLVGSRHYSEENIQHHRQQAGKPQGRSSASRPGKTVEPLGGAVIERALVRDTSLLV